MVPSWLKVAKWSLQVVKNKVSELSLVLKDNSDFQTNKSATVKASLLVLDDGKKSIFLPMNSDVICADFINEDNQNKVHFSFYYEKIKELLQGASICLNTSGKSDVRHWQFINI